MRNRAWKNWNVSRRGRIYPPGNPGNISHLGKKENHLRAFLGDMLAEGNLSTSWFLGEPKSKGETQEHQGTSYPRAHGIGGLSYKDTTIVVTMMK